MSIAQSNCNHSNNSGSTLQDFFPFETRSTYNPNSWADMMDQQDTENLEQQIKEKLQAWYDIINASTIQKTSKKRTKKISEWVMVEKPKKIKIVETPEVKNPNSDTTLILKGLPYDDTEDDDLMKRFEHYGPIRFITVLRNKDGTCKGLAFVRFVYPASVDILLQRTQYFLYNGRKVIVERTK